MAGYGGTDLIGVEENAFNLVGPDNVLCHHVQRSFGLDLKTESSHHAGDTPLQHPDLREKFKDDVFESAEIELKYKGYIERERQLADKISRLENLAIPENFDFNKVSGLSIECRQKLLKYAPKTLAQASRISGVSPADVSVLLVYLEKK